MHADRRVKIWIRMAHDRGRRPARREPCNVDALWIDRIAAHDLACDPRNQCRLASITLLVALSEPVPALLRVRRMGLTRVDHQAGVFLSCLVHAGTNGKV